MIITMQDTTATQVQKRLIRAREEAGAVALGRVLTFLIHTPQSREEEAIAAANDASREHPMRIVVIADSAAADSDHAGLDAEIRVGGDAGASEVVILRPRGQAGAFLPAMVNGLLLPDAPVVTWWPDQCPRCMADTDLGQISQRRILDSSHLGSAREALSTIASGYRPGDTDLAWARITGWRTQLAATLDYLDARSISSVRVNGIADNPSVVLLAGWLALSLGESVTIDHSAPVGIGGVHQVLIDTDAGEISLTRLDDHTVRLVAPGQPDYSLFLPRRNLAGLLAEELRRLGPDPVYGDVLSRGLPRLTHTGH